MIDVKNASNNGMNCLNGSYPLTFGGRGLLEAGQVGEYFPRLRMMTTGFALPPAL